MADLERVAIRTERKLDELLSLINQPKVEGVSADFAAALTAINERLAAIEAAIAKTAPAKK